MPVIPLLGLLFVGLKLTGYLGWSWLWVTAPFWGGFALIVLLFALGAVGFGAGLMAAHGRAGRRRAF